MTEYSRPDKARYVCDSLKGPDRLGMLKWGVNLDTLDVDYDKANIEMCDHGAACVEEGFADALEFRCMPFECDEIRAYMAAKHPAIKFYFR